MQHNPNKLREDILGAIQEVEGFCLNKTFNDLQRERALQLIVERELEIIGEALSRLRKDHPALGNQIRDIHKIIGLRNVLAHGYDVLDNEILWDIVENKIPLLKHDVQAIQV